MTEHKSINQEPKRTFTVAESILWTKLCGVQFATEVAATVSLEEISKGYKKPAAVANDVAAIRYGNSTANSITNYLCSPVFCKLPKLVRKNTKAATVEAAKVAAESRGKAKPQLETIKTRVFSGLRASGFEEASVAALEAAYDGWWEGTATEPGMRVNAAAAWQEATQGGHVVPRVALSARGRSGHVRDA